MILNYNELLICIKKIGKQISQLKLEQHNLIINLNFIKTRQVFAKQKLLELQILNYITHYQEKIKNNHLESKIYSHKLNDLKKDYQSKTNANEFIYCLKELAETYNDFIKDLKIFYRFNRLEDVNAVKEKIKNHTSVMEEIFLELSRLILLQDSITDKNQIADFNTFAVFFQEHYSAKTIRLKKEIDAKKRALRSFKVFLNFRLMKLIRIEIKDSKAELETITNANIKLIDQIKWEYVII